MARLWQESAYVSMARSAAALLGASNPGTVRGILAQWSCEQPNPAPWPPALNNPGNLTSAVGDLDGGHHKFGRAIGHGAFLYAYATPEAGAEAYATYLLRSSRYHAALAAARAGDGLGFVVDVCRSGYGTGESCVRAVFADIGGQPGPVEPPVRPPSVAEWVATADAINVRAGSGTDHTVVGAIHRGQRVAGPIVLGSPYQAGHSTSREWIDLGHGRYAAAAFFRRA